MADETPHPSSTPVEPDSTSHGVEALETSTKKPKTYEKRKSSLAETSQNDVTSSPCSDNSPATTSSPQNTSRYGRARKPKITEDFYNTEDIFGPYERIPCSPVRTAKKKQPLKLELSPNKSNDFVTLDVDAIKPDLNAMLSINIPDEQFEVSKVMKIVSNNTSDEFSPKSPSFTKPVKTYSGKREKQNSESMYESFGLPDYPSGENCPYVNGLSHSEDSGSENEDTEKMNTTTSTTTPTTSNTTTKTSASTTTTSTSITTEIRRTKFNLLSLKKNIKSPVKHLIQSDNISTSTPAIKSDAATIKKKLTKHKLKVAKMMKNKFRLQKKPIPISRLKAKKMKPLKKVRAPKVNSSAESSDESQTDNKKQIEAIDDLQKMYMPEVGDLTWSRVGSFPFWPSIVTKEPNSERHTRTINFGKRLTHFYHVNFFGDNGRRSWVLQTHIFPFHQRSDLEIMAKSVSKDAKPKEPRHLSAYIINPTKLIKWETAVTEAESLSGYPKDKRIKKFFEMVSPKKKSKKRSRDSPASSISSAGKITKKDKLKKKTVKNYFNDMAIKEEIKDEADNVDDDDDDISDASGRNNRRKTNKKRKPSLVSEDSFTDSEKLEVAVKEEMRDSPSPVLSSSVRMKKINLFKGISRERVCQICGKSNNVYKCKGQCYGQYHIECDRKQRQRLRIPVACDDKTDFETLIGENIVGKPIKQEEVTSAEVASSIVENIVTNVFENVLPTETEPSLSIAEQIDLKMQEVMKNVVESNYQDSATDYSSGSETGQNSETGGGRSGSQIGETFDETELSTQKGSKMTKKVIKHVTADGTFDIIQEEVEPEDHSNFKCTYCSTGYKPPCFICNKDKTKSGDVKKHKCMTAQCGKYYHAECLKDWPQTKWYLSTKRKEIDNENLSCPYHNCHTCISDDPRGPFSRMGHEKLAKCIRCPTTYHTKNHCVPAGTEILSNYQIICPKHLISNYAEQSEQNVKDKKAVPKKYMHHVNASWCFICSIGGSLICCETCPSSFHVECLKMTPPEGKYICEECEGGRLPLYDEIVWVKLGSYRWWPAQILFPIEIPENVRNIAHNKGEFVVRFFGSHDHYWVNRGRVFLFQEGDTGHASNKKTAADRLFVKAIKEATKAHQKFVDERANKMADSKSSMKPPSYIKIKVNKPVGDVRITDADTSNTTPCDCDPNWDQPCGPDSDCLNRILLTECNPAVCAAGNRCCNQSFQNREYAHVEPFKTSARGWGLRTLAPITMGTFVIEYVGEVINETEYMRRMRRKHEQKDENYYFLTIDKDRMIDAGPKGNVARFMNHSCSPNCETQKWTVNGDTKVGLFAIKDIPEGAELTFNYNLECIGEEKKECRCGAPNCSGFIGVKAKQDELLKKKKGKKTYKRKPPIQETRDFEVISCFVCQKTNAIQQCDRENCNKFYHLECVNLETLQEGKWFCPWHSCNTCTKRTTRCCYMCTNSFCPLHSEGNIRYDRVKGFICKEHDTAEFNAQNIEYNPEPPKLKKKKPKTIAEQDLEEILKYDKTSPKIRNRNRKKRSKSDRKGKSKKEVHANSLANLKQYREKLRMLSLMGKLSKTQTNEETKETNEEETKNISISNEVEVPKVMKIEKTNGLHPEVAVEKADINEPLTQNNNLAIKKRKSRLSDASASEEDDNLPLSKRFKIDEVQNITKNIDSPKISTRQRVVTPKKEEIVETNILTSKNEIKDLKQKLDKTLETNEMKQTEETINKATKNEPEAKEKLNEILKDIKQTIKKSQVQTLKEVKQTKEIKEKLDKASNEIVGTSKDAKEPCEKLDITPKKAKEINEKLNETPKGAKEINEKLNETLWEATETSEKRKITPKKAKETNEKLDKISKEATETNEKLKITPEKGKKTNEKLDKISKEATETNEKLNKTSKEAKEIYEKVDITSKKAKETNEKLEISKEAKETSEKVDITSKEAKEINKNVDLTSKKAKETNEKLDKPLKEAKETSEKLDKTSMEAKEINKKMDITSKKANETNEQLEEISKEAKETSEKLDKTSKEATEINKKVDITSKKAKETNEKLDKISKESKETSEKLDKTSKEANEINKKVDITLKKTKETNEKLDKTSKEAKETSEKPDKTSKQAKEINKKLDTTSKKAKETNEKLEKIFKEAKETIKKMNISSKKAKETNEKLDKKLKEAKETNKKLDVTSKEAKQAKEKLDKSSERIEKTKEFVNKTPKDVKQTNEKLYKTLKEAKQTKEKLDKTSKGTEKIKETVDRTERTREKIVKKQKVAKPTKAKLNKTSEKSKPSDTKIVTNRSRGRPRKHFPDTPEKADKPLETPLPEIKMENPHKTENKLKQKSSPEINESFNSSTESESYTSQSQSSEYDSECTTDDQNDSTDDNSQPIIIVDLECDAEEAIAKSVINKDTLNVVSIKIEKPDQIEAKPFKNESKRMKLMSPRPGVRKSLRISDPFDTSSSTISNNELEISLELNCSTELEEHLGLPELNSTLLEEKRGPGRPKSSMKKKIVVGPVRKSNRFSSNNESTIEIPPEETIIDSFLSTTENTSTLRREKSQKRKRGRPRKHFNSPPPVQTPKRPLGRPKKIKLLEESPKQHEIDEARTQYKFKLNTTLNSPETKPKTPSFESHVNEIKLTTNVPERHLRVMLRKTEIESKAESKFLKMQNDIERDLPIRKRSKLRYETHL